MTDKKPQFFISNPTEQLFVFFDKPLDLYEPLWNPKFDKNITFDHFFTFLEKGLLLNFYLLPLGEEKAIDPTILGEQTFYYFLNLGMHFLRAIGSYQKNNNKMVLWFPKPNLLRLQPGYKDNKEKRHYENFPIFAVYDASKIFDRFKVLLKNDTEVNQKIKISLFLHIVFEQLRTFYEGHIYSAEGIIFIFDNKDRDNIFKLMNLTRWEDESFKVYEKEVERLIHEDKTKYPYSIPENCGYFFYVVNPWKAARSSASLFLETLGISEEYYKNSKIKECWCDKFHT